MKSIKHAPKKKEESKKHEKKEHEKPSKKKPHALIKHSKKIEKVMHEFGAGELHSGSKKGPIVSKRKQAVAIALSEARKAKIKK